MQHTLPALLIGAALLAAPVMAAAQTPAKPAATAAAPAVELDRASFNGPVPPGALKTAEASRAFAADAFARYLKQGAPAKARAIKRLRLTWGGGATEPVAWIERDALVLQYFWDGAPKRDELTFAIGCAFSPGKGACAEQGD